MSDEFWPLIYVRRISPSWRLFSRQSLSDLSLPPVKIMAFTEITEEVCWLAAASTGKLLC